MAERIIVELNTDASKGDAALKSFEDRLKKTANEFSGAITTRIVAAATTIAGVLGGGAIFKKAIDEATKTEDAINGLNAALANSGQYSAEASAGLVAYADSLQNVTRYESAAIVESAALIQSLSGIGPEALKPATQAALDLSAALKIDLNTASSLVGKAAEGNVAAFHKFGIEVKAGATDSETFARALQAINEKFGGRAAADAETFSGRIAQIGNAFDDALGGIGKMIIQSPTLLAVLGVVQRLAQKAAAAIEDFGKNRDIVLELAQVMVRVGQAMATYVIPPLEFAYNLTKIFVSAFLTGFSAIAAGALRLYQLLNENLFEPVRIRVASFARAFGGDFGAGIATGIETANSAVRVSLDTLIPLADEYAVKFGETTQTSIASAFDFGGSMMFEQSVASLDTWVQNMTPYADQAGRTLAGAMAAPASDPSLWGDFVTGWSIGAKTVVESSKQMSASIQELGKQMGATFKTGFSTAFAAMGSAMAKGQNGLDAFGKAFLGVLGDLAIQSGAFFMTMGIARSIMLDPTGPLIFAAGAALTVLGGALKALGGGGGAGESGGAVANSPTGSQGGGVVVGADPDVTEPTQRERGNAVQVHVHGNVFNNRETALEIASVMNDAWGSNAAAVPSTS